MDKTGINGFLLLIALATLGYICLFKLARLFKSNQGTLKQQEARKVTRQGLQQVYPALDAPDDTTVDIIAIHGLDTSAPTTWECRSDDQRIGDERKVINWLSDNDMLPKAVPRARIITYNWHTQFSKDAIELTLRDHANSLLLDLNAFRDRTGEPKTRPIVFIASCFGGLVLAKALTISASSAGRENGHGFVRDATVGVVFLGTPFKGTPAQRLAQWLVAYEGFMGEKASLTLIRDLGSNTKVLDDLVEQFLRGTNELHYHLPLHCFYETRPKNLTNKVLPLLLDEYMDGLPERINANTFLVDNESASLQGRGRTGLDCSHLMMNKFCPETNNFSRVGAVIRKFVSDAEDILSRRKIGYQAELFVVPYGRNSGFVGRESIMTIALAKIPPGVCPDDCQRTAIVGLGGVGKTQIALEAAFRVRDQGKDCFIFWVPAINAVTFENAYRDIGKKLHIPGINDDDADVTALSQSTYDWVLIVDNADDTDVIFGHAGFLNYLPFSHRGSILFTTRNHQIAMRLVARQENIIAATKMSRDEALEMLQSHLGAQQLQDAESTTSLLEFLSDLPLAIRQASAHMKIENMTATRYLEHCRTSDARFIELLSDGFEDLESYDAIQNSVATTWWISFRHMSQRYAPAVKLLKFMSFLAERDIPRSLLPELGHDLEMNEYLGTLKAYAFITEKNQASYDMHRLVRLAMQNWLVAERELEECVTNVLDHIARTFPLAEHETREICKRGWGLLSGKVAGTNHILGKYEDARISYQQSYEICAQTVGPEHYLTLRVKDQIAKMLGKLGKFKEAEKLHRSIFATRIRVLGGGHSDVAQSMHSLATILFTQGRYAEAEKLYRDALAIQRERFGNDGSTTIMTMRDLVLVLIRQKQYIEAEKLGLSALAIEQRAFGKDHPDTLTSIRNVTIIYHVTGNLEKSEKLHQEALEIRLRVLGSDHPKTATEMYYLAATKYRLGKYREAQKLLTDSVPISIRVFGRNHRITVENLCWLAKSLFRLGQYEKAKLLQQEVLALRTEVYGPGHWYVLRATERLADSLLKLREYEDAETMLRNLVVSYTRLQGKDSLDTLCSMHNHGLSLFRLGRYEEGKDVMGRVVSLRTKALGIDHPQTRGSLRILTSWTRERDGLSKWDVS
ncbi:Nephrocystin-3-like protein [Cladobotryum mycophilum]|uniref:Nephrocystin-3-like protein n=1 Tax=Cladobotryum mycophilum TaxID=491253 RepID=A0ABR0SSY8_9HYPO